MQGHSLFERHGCANCHNPETYTSDAAYDVDLEDELGNPRFNPPSLRGVSQRQRLFHDNRAADIEGLLGRFQHGVRQPLSPSEVADMVNYLQSL